MKPTQSHRIILGLKETFIKRYIVEKTIKAEIRPEEQSEKAKRERGGGERDGERAVYVKPFGECHLDNVNC